MVALLQQAPEVTIEELAQALDMAAATVRRHLDILQRDRLVSYRVVRHKPGRPQHAYFLTDEGHEALPKRYQNLLNWILQSLVSDGAGVSPSSQGHDVELLLVDIANRIAEPYRERYQGRPIPDRVAVLQELLEAEQFAPSVEEGDGMVKTHLLNCPYRVIAMENPVVCALDRQLISLVLGSDASPEERINRNSHHCIYTVPV
jgi:DeoR family suf operon transcriptional repressor